MDWLSKILGGGVGTLVKDVVGTFKLSPAAKQEFETAMAENEHEIRLKELEMQTAADEMLTKEIDAKKSIMVAELQHGSNFAKNARPSVIYGGLLFIFLNHVLFPYIAFFTSKEVPSISLPPDFWWAWTGICSAWIIGRTMERRGAKDKVTQIVTGS